MSRIPLTKLTSSIKVLNFFLPLCSALLLFYVWIKWKLFFCLSTCLVRKNLFLFGGCVFSSKGCKVLLKRVYKKKSLKKLTAEKKTSTEKNLCCWSSFLFVSIKRQRHHVAPKHCCTKWVPDDSCILFELVLESERFQPSTRRDSRKRGTRDRAEAGRNTKRIFGWNLFVSGRCCDTIFVVETF